MPFHKKVHSPWSVFNGHKKTINHELPTTNHKPKGFTLIELIVVIALIGILSGVGSMAFNNSQKKGRDAKRKADLAEVKKALEAARNDCTAGSYYPAGAISLTILYTSSYLNITNSSSLSSSKLGYLQKQQNDPLSAQKYGYAIHHDLHYGDNQYYAPSRCPNGTNLAKTSYGTSDFVLFAKLEITTDPDSTKTYNSCKSKIDLAVYWGQGGNITPAAGDGYYYLCND